MPRHDEPTRPAPQPGVPRRIGRFQIEGEIARGGTAVVYHGVDPHLGRPVALKLLLDEACDGTEGARLEREARLAARLSHPGIITIHEVGAAMVDGSQRRYVAMDRVDGPTLDRAVRRMGLAPRVRLLAQVAEAVGHAHAHGVIHRDLKPANILVGADGQPIVTDFGLGHDERDLATRLTQTGAVMGTAPYMAPEQVEGARDLDARTDVWALGVILYELLTDRRPFRGSTTPTLFHQILEAHPRRPRSLRPRVPRPLEAVCLRALSLEPDRRYATAAELATDLGRWSDGERVSARPPSTLSRLQHRARRHPWVGAVLLLVIPLLALAAWRWSAAVSARRTLDRLRSEARQAVATGDWTGALGAATRALEHGEDGELRRLADQARAALARAPQARSTGDPRRRRLAALGRQVQEFRALLYRAEADLRGPLERVARALEALQRESADTDDAAAWSLVGRGWAAVGRLHLAEPALRRAVALDATDAAAHAALGRLLMRRSLAVLLEKDAPDRAQRAEAIARAALGHLDRSRTPWEGASKLELAVARGYRALAAGEDEVVRAHCTSAFAAFGDPPGSEALHFLLGWLETDLPRRLAHWDRGLARCPHDAWMRCLRGLVRLNAGDRAGAVADYDEALRVNPYLALGYRQRGTMRVDTDPRGALADLDRAVALRPDDALSVHNRGLVHGKLGNHAAAETDHRRALQLRPRYHRAYVGLAIIARDRGDLAAARRDLDRGLALAPGDPIAWTFSARLRLQAGDRAGAEADLERALGADPEHVSAIVERGQLRAERGQSREALADYTRALQLDDTHPDALRARGRLHARTRRHREAVIDFTRALERAPRMAAIYVDRGAALTSLRQVDDAERDYRKALELEPGNWRALAGLAAAAAMRGQFGEAAAMTRRAIAAAPPVEHAGLRRLLGILEARARR